MSAETCGPTFCPSSLVPKSKRLHRLEVQSRFVPKLSRHGGKNIAIAQKPVSLQAQLIFDVYI